MLQVNGGQRAGSLSPEFDDIDNSVHLVYTRPSDHHQQQYTFSTRKDRYYSADGISLEQVGALCKNSPVLITETDAGGTASTVDSPAT